jgi:hypothetical protein
MASLTDLWRPRRAPAPGIARGPRPGRLPDAGGRGRNTFSVSPIDTFGGLTTLDSHRQDWQAEAWRAYRNTVGEFAAVVNWRADAISRTKLFVARLSDDTDADPCPVEDPLLGSLLERLGSGGSTGYSQLLKRMSIHLDVPGETLLVGHETVEGHQSWFPASLDQLTTWGGETAIQIDNTGNPTLDYITAPRPQDPAVGGPQRHTTIIRRIWEPDPKEPWLAISAARYAQKPLRILDRLTDRVNANTLSRLMNGLMLVSSDVLLPTMPDRSDLHADPEMAGLIYAATTAIADAESPSAVLPIIGRVAGEITDKIQKIDFGTSFDEELVPLFDLFIRRLALMLDVPPEILLGIGDSSTFANAYLVSEDAVRIHLTPTIEMMCDGLTRAYLRPAIHALNVQAGRVIYDPTLYTVWYDTSPITKRADRAEDARADYEAGVISDEALRRATGFGDDDAPDPEETRVRILTQLALAGVPLVDAEPYLRAMGISLDPPPPAPAAPVRREQ